MKKVAIVGGGPTWDDAPFDDHEYEIWVLGNQINRYQGLRIDRIFEIHDDLSEHSAEYPDYLLDLGLPLVVGHKFPYDPDKHNQVIVYPYNAVREIMDGDHLTSSPAYMMGMAVLEGFDEIAIYGTCMAVDDHEYFYQRPTMYAWIGYAKAKGIHVTTTAGLFVDTYIEGGETPLSALECGPFTEANLSEMVKIHDESIEKIDNKVLEMQVTRATHDGARQAYVRLRAIARAHEAGAQVGKLTDSFRIQE